MTHEADLPTPHQEAVTTGRHSLPGVETQTHASVAVVRLDDLRPGYSPRLGGENSAHARMLAELDVELPRILVHRATMRIIDGMHRYRAARIRGDETINVEFFDGSEETAFVRAVEANIAHGLPLSYADREAAAIRIIASHPERSDRAIAASTGLATRTVRSVRARVTADQPQVTARVGLDGRTRPLDSTDGRLLAQELIKLRPDAPLREIASMAGISVSTAHDVRERVRCGEDPVPEGLRQRRRARSEAAMSADRNARDAGPMTRDVVSTLRRLQRDPSLRLTEAGRSVLKLLSRCMIDRDEWAELSQSIPSHSTIVVAELARSYAYAWNEISEELGKRGPAAQR